MDGASQGTVIDSGTGSTIDSIFAARIDSNFDAGSSLVVVPQPTPDSPPASIFIIRDAGVVVDLTRGPVCAPHPQMHACNLLQNLMQDEDLAGRPATEKALKKYYAAV